MKTQLIYISFSLLVFCCQNKEGAKTSGKESKCNYHRSMQVINEDTLNVVDCNGKQGIWIPHHDNDLKDTVFFKNDKIESLPVGWSKSNNYALIRESWSKK
jgi:hypothetical protein